MSIDNIEKLKRQAMVEEAINSVELEGLTVCSEQRKRYQQYINGDLSLEELDKLTKAAYGTEN